jgi:hypothetical protein
MTDARQSLSHPQKPSFCFNHIYAKSRYFIDIFSLKCSARQDLYRKLLKNVQKEKIAQGRGRTYDITVAKPRSHTEIPELTAVRNNHYATQAFMLFEIKIWIIQCATFGYTHPMFFRTALGLPRGSV